MTARRKDEEKPEELRARALLERELGCELSRVGAAGEPRVDYRAPGRRTGIEVKRVTNEVYNDLTKAYRRARHRDGDTLTGRWSVIIDRPTLSTSLAPVPDFPQDDPGLIADMEAMGWTVARRDDRVAEWRASHPGPKSKAGGPRARDNPQLRNLPRDLEPHLVVLEEHGHVTTRGLHYYGQPPELATAIVEITRRTGGAMCLRREPLGDERPGIDIVLGSSYLRTEHANTIVARVDLWLRSDWSENLLTSLGNEPPGAERHAVLVFDAETEPEYHSAVEQGTAFCPTVHLDMPEEIDVLWFILGPIAARFAPSEGWTTVLMPDAPISAKASRG